MFEERYIKYVRLCNNQVLLNTSMGSEIVLNITDLNDVEKFDDFSTGRMPQLRLDILKFGSGNVDDVGMIALNVDSSLFVAVMFSGVYQYYGPLHMGIGNLESSARNCKSSLRVNRKYCESSLRVNRK